MFGTMYIVNCCHNAEQGDRFAPLCRCNALEVRKARVVRKNISSQDQGRTKYARTKRKVFTNRDETPSL